MEEKRTRARQMGDRTDKGKLDDSIGTNGLEGTLPQNVPSEAHCECGSSFALDTKDFETKGGN